MKQINTFLIILFISLLSSPSWSETMDDLVERNGLYYKQFTDVPFTGNITGDEQVSFKNGKREGAWVRYFDNGQLSDKGNFKNGYKVGAWVGYHDNGQLLFKGNYKDGYKEGVWINYWEDGTVRKKHTGTFKNGKKISD